jgi:hypothetical protein
MAALNLEELYDRYIRPLPPEERLRLLAMTARDLAQTSEGAQDRPKRSILELEGLGAELWEGVDAQAYIHELRKEWDHRS